MNYNYLVEIRHYIAKRKCTQTQQQQQQQQQQLNLELLLGSDGTSRNTTTSDTQKKESQNTGSGTSSMNNAQTSTAVSSSIEPTVHSLSQSESDIIHNRDEDSEGCISLCSIFYKIAFHSCLNSHF
jgi:hypothetical protein